MCYLQTSLGWMHIWQDGVQTLSCQTLTKLCGQLELQKGPGPFQNSIRQWQLGVERRTHSFREYLIYEKFKKTAEGGWHPTTELVVVSPWDTCKRLLSAFLVKHSFCLSKNLLCKSWWAKMMKPYKARSHFSPLVTWGKMSFLQV